MIALDPGLYYYYVVQAHNDLTAIFLVVAGTAIAARKPLLGAFVAGAAGLIKIVFAYVAVLALNARSPRRITYGQLAVILTLVAGGSLLGGSGYLHAMSAVAMRQYGAQHDAVHRVDFGLRVVLAALSDRVRCGRRFPGCVFPFGAVYVLRPERDRLPVVPGLGHPLRRSYFFCVAADRVSGNRAFHRSGLSVLSSKDVRRRRHA